jgi:hypothetical protein
MYPEDVLPWHPQPMEVTTFCSGADAVLLGTFAYKERCSVQGDFTTNTRLQAIRLFEGEMDGSGTVQSAAAAAAAVHSSCAQQQHKLPGSVCQQCVDLATRTAARAVARYSYQYRAAMHHLNVHASNE